MMMLYAQIFIGGQGVIQRRTVQGALHHRRQDIGSTSSDVEQSYPNSLRRQPIREWKSCQSQRGIGRSH